MTECRDLALKLAGWGGSVVPARVMMSEGEWCKASVRSWPSKATSDSNMWRQDWFTWGGHWWVAVCPRVGGLVALDLDGPEAVEVARAAIRSGELPWTGDELAYSTPGHGGGLHIWWRWPPSLPAFSRLVTTLPAGGEVDLRGEAGFVLMYGAPRPDLPDEASYRLASAPRNGGPPPAPTELWSWIKSLGPSTAEAAPTHQGKQISPDQLAAIAAAQGGIIRQDRHSTLFRACSWLRVRKGFNTFEALATELWRLVETYFDMGEEGVEHWQNEVIRVSKNARAYTETRDKDQREAAQRALVALGIGPLNN